MLQVSCLQLRRSINGEFLCFMIKRIFSDQIAATLQLQPPKTIYVGADLILQFSVFSVPNYCRLKSPLTKDAVLLCCYITSQILGGDGKEDDDVVWSLFFLSL